MTLYRALNRFIRAPPKYRHYDSTQAEYNIAKQDLLRQKAFYLSPKVISTSY